MADKLKNLLSVKSIISLLLTIVFCYLSIVGVITADYFIPIFTTVIAFYFGVQVEKKNKSNGDIT